MISSPRRPSPAARATRRSRRPAPRSKTLLERYRTPLLWGGGIALLAGLVFVAFVGPTLTPAYACVNFFEPTPAPSWTPPPTEPPASGATPAPAVTAPAPGYVQPDMGRQHETQLGRKVTYTWCPPASGRHYNIAGFGPIKAGFYNAGEKQVPPGWVHNLEHGAIVLLYKCPGEACEAAGQSALESLYARWPESPICKIAAGGFTPVIARFDDMPYPYAAIVWDMVLPLQTLDEQAILSFYAAYGERANPEKQCPAPTGTPGAPTPTPTAAPPSASPASSGAGSPAPSASPAGS